MPLFSFFCAHDLTVFFACVIRYSAYHHSHPTLSERLKALEGFQAKKVKKE